MFSSTIIPTIGRSSLSRAVNSVLEQKLASNEFEVIVVNDSGAVLAPAEWQQASNVQIIHTQKRERSVARNTGAALAKGSYLHFLDDDDWLAPGALENFWQLAQQSEAAWLYGSSQLIDRDGTPLIQLRHGMQGNRFVQTMAGEWIPLQASLIRADCFFQLGGFNPYITGPEDVDLLRRVALVGTLAETTAVVATVGMGTQNSTTDYVHHAEASRWAREQLLNQTNVFNHMLASADNASWRGRMVRIYLTSAAWNLRRGRLFSAGSRLGHALAAMVYALPTWGSTDFWQAISHSYESSTFLQGFTELNRSVERR